MAFLGHTDSLVAFPAHRYAETVMPLRFGWSPLCAIRNQTWKYVEAPEPELYDLSNDPGETTNLLPERPSRADSLRTVLRSMVAEFTSHSLEPGTVNLEEDTRKALEALGYLD